ncbi:MAG TPA: bifunctional 2-polyprenyl-6-hydroxyphenol methylase/3-demethylubiquinol 3-O-methyltransferase UbiG [Limnobacter sp.]|uniref:bifunctional 2-polyprenyl-6-hydroxyphenol methylase/3-demethylubiquinol 3-O-methyltransferase UbiG n=1 Tax=Limnobacter sp. TaxID=2003368 RepID=UPI002ED9A845
MSSDLNTQPGTQTNPNVDPAELAKFSALASKWWDPNSEFRPLHQINPLRLNWIDERAGLKGKTVLDVGCGGGILAESMARRGANVLGIDLADKSLKVAELHKLESGVQNLAYRAVSAEQLAQEQPAQYDVVTCLEMLEHVPNPAQTVQACADLCKPGGWLFFSTINRNPKSFMFAIVGAEYVLQLLPKGTHAYEKFIKPSELAQYTRRAGLDTSEIIGLTYNPITKIYKLARDTDVNYMIACRKPA